jgi:hypothetical protein
VRSSREVDFPTERAGIRSAPRLWARMRKTAGREPAPSPLIVPDATQRNLMRLTNVLISGVWAKAENERSPPVGHRNVSDSVRRRDVGGWAVVYRKKVSQASGRPSRTNGVGPGDKPFANLPSVKSKLSPPRPDALGRRPLAQGSSLGTADAGEGPMILRQRAAGTNPPSPA